MDGYVVAQVGLNIIIRTLVGLELDFREDRKNRAANYLNNG
jgi:hypothetical protein